MNKRNSLRSDFIFSQLHLESDTLLPRTPSSLLSLKVNYFPSVRTALFLPLIPSLSFPAGLPLDYAAWLCSIFIRKGRKLSSEVHRRRC